jgi:hypothetical protein
MQMNIKHFAARLYHRYTRQTGNKTYDGKECPPWSDLPDGVRQGWIAVADEASIVLTPSEHVTPHPEVLPAPKSTRPVGPNGE